MATSTTLLVDMLKNWYPVCNNTVETKNENENIFLNSNLMVNYKWND